MKSLEISLCGCILRLFILKTFKELLCQFLHEASIKNKTFFEVFSVLTATIEKIGLYSEYRNYLHL